MDFNIFLFRARIPTEIPANQLTSYLKRKAIARRKFTLGGTSKLGERFYYGDQENFRKRLGYKVGSSIEILVTASESNRNGSKVVLKVPDSRLIGYLLLSVFIVIIGVSALPDLGLAGSLLIVALVYFGIVIDFNSQRYYLKSDLESMEEHYKRDVQVNER